MFGTEFLLGLVNTLGYFGVFLIGILSSFTLFIPSPAFIVVFLLGAMMNPFLLGIVAGFGSAVGEMTSYGVGYGAEFLAEKRKKELKKKINKIEKLFEKHHPDLLIFAFAAVPLLPIDAMGIFCGVIKYDKKKFFLMVLIAKIIKYLLVAYAGYYGLQWVIEHLPFEL